jgi:hypothetical protein
LRRAIFQHAVPLYVVKVHPIKIFQLLSITKVFTSQSDVPVPGLKEVSREPSLLRRAIPFLAVPLYVVKVHPIKIFQLLSIAIAFILLIPPNGPVPGLKEVSREPSVLSRTKPFRVTPLYDEKFPPTIILLSDWIAIHEYTVPLSHVPRLKEVSREPSLLRRAMRFREVQL